MPPNEEELLVLAQLLEAHVHLDQELQMRYHTSMKGFAAVRVFGVTYGTEWFVDAYRGPYYYLRVPGFEAVTSDNPFTMVTTLLAMLKGK